MVVFLLMQQDEELHPPGERVDRMTLYEQNCLFNRIKQNSHPPNNSPPQPNLVAVLDHHSHMGKTAPGRCHDLSLHMCAFFITLKI